MNPNDETYKNLVSLRDSLDRRHSELLSEMNDVERKLESVSTTLALLEGSELPLSHRLNPTHTSSSSPTPSTIDVAGLKGLTQADALEKIAEHNGGILHTALAKKVLLQAGLIKNPKNAANILFNVIQRSGRFERVEPGMYRLIGNKPEPPLRLSLDAPKSI